MKFALRLCCRGPFLRLYHKMHVFLLRVNLNVCNRLDWDRVGMERRIYEKKMQKKPKMKCPSGGMFDRIGFFFFFSIHFLFVDELPHCWPEDTKAVFCFCFIGSPGAYKSHW